MPERGRVVLLPAAAGLDIATEDLCETSGTGKRDRDRDKEKEREGKVLQVNTWGVNRQSAEPADSTRQRFCIKQSKASDEVGLF